MKSMSDFLTAMALASRLRAEGVREEIGEAELASLAESARPVVALDLARDGFDLIAETKLASPSAGRLAAPGDDLEAVLTLSSRLESAGAAAVSVLTEPVRFAGDMSHLRAVSAERAIPVMRKDFLVDPIQVLEARVAGASGVLLICRILDGGRLTEMTDLVLELGMFALVELFDEADLDAASAVFDREILIGVNARDLTTLQLDRGRHARMARLLPGHLSLVAESGIVDGDGAARVSALGYRMALVGTGLMASAEPGALAGELIRRGRSAARVREVS